MKDAVRYRVPGPYRVGMLAVFALFSILAVFLMAVAVYDGQVGVLVAVALVWAVMVGPLAYLYLFRIVYEPEFDGERLCWHSPLRSGEVALADLTRVRAVGPGANGFLEVASGRRIRVFVRKGFIDFVSTLVAVRPELAVRIGFGVRMAERWPGRSAFGEHG